MSNKTNIFLLTLGSYAMAAVSVQAANIYVSSQTGLYVVGYSQSGSQQFSTNVSGQPLGLALDAAGNVYAGVFAPGTAGNTVQKFTAAGAPVGTYSTLPNGVTGPFDLAFDNTGSLYVSALNSNAVDKFDSNGNFVGTLATVASPRGLAFDPNGNLYVVSSANGGAVYEIPKTATSTLNQTPGAVLSFAAGLADPRYLAFDASGNAYVSNTGTGGSTGYIEKYSLLSPGLFNTPAVFAAGLGGPNGLGFDASGNLFVADYFDGNVREFSASGASLGVFKAGILTANGLAVGAGAVPEPMTAGLIGLGLAALAWTRRKA